MVYRRAHRKSRLGCLTCKQRRVKCDESGPPCGPCATRSVQCKYAQASPSPREPTVANNTAKAAHNGSLADPSMSWSPSLRQRELQLLHQWSTVTYKSYCGTVEDEYHNWQVVIPNLAFQHDCLLDGLFAMSALELGAFSDNEVSQDYIDIALEYQNRASSKLREELATHDLTTVTQDKHQALWALSSILMVLAMAIPPYNLHAEAKLDMVEHIMTFLELLKGLGYIVASKIESFREDPLLCKYKQWDELEANEIPLEDQSALDRLKSLNEQIHGSGSPSKERNSELRAMTYHAACRKAIFHLEECIAKCFEPHTRAYGLAWLAFCGPDYASAIKDREPLALLILMHWGMYLEIQSYGVWYVKKVGVTLVEDLSDGLPLLGSQEMADAIRWVRNRVGLD